MDPQSLTYRSPVYRYLRDLDATFDDVNGYAVATSVGDAGAQTEAARTLALCDLSGLPRTGFKGPRVGRWLADQALSLPSGPNRAARQDDGSLLAMLADNEGLVLCDLELQSGIVGQLEQAFAGMTDAPDSPGGLVVPRQHGHAWLRVTGHELAATFAKLCAIDLRPGIFDNLRVAQTSVARLSAIVVRDDLGDIPAIHLLADSASAGYLWECILDAGAEHDIQVIGLDAVRELGRS